MNYRRSLFSILTTSLLISALWLSPGTHAAEPARTIQTVPGMPPVIDPNNLYSETRSNRLSPVVAKHLSRVYVPNRSSNDVWVIDPQSLKVVDKFKVGIHPQHVVPSWDLKTLWVNNNAEGRTDGSVTPIDPLTGKPGKNIPWTIPTTCTLRPVVTPRSSSPRRVCASIFAIRTPWR